MTLVRRRLARGIMTAMLFVLTIHLLTKILNNLSGVGGSKLSKDITLLLWFWPPDHQLEQNICKSKFDIEGCRLTADRSQLASAEGVLFRTRDITRNLSSLSLRQSITQRWIWMHFGFPERSAMISGLGSLFNITMSYREDADIVIQRQLVARSEDVPSNLTLPAKTKSICSEDYSLLDKRDPRQEYYSNLTEHIFVEVISQRQNTLYPEVYSKAMENCKFYLILERNDDSSKSNMEYVSEILHNSLRWGTVPVVSGPPKTLIEKVIPRGAFIHAADFPGPKELADYLHTLDKNEYHYKQLLLWYNDFTVKDFAFPLEHACLACNYISQTTKKL